MKRRHLEALAHLSFWVLCYWIFLMAFAETNVFVEESNGVRKSTVVKNYLYLPVASFIASKIFIFYLNGYWLLPTAHQKRAWRAYAFGLVALLSVAQLFEIGINQLSHLNVVTGDRIFLLTVLPLSLLLNVIFWGISTAYYLSKNFIRNEQMKHLLRQEKLAAEVQYLRSQINPHFLFNTLNNLFALSERVGNHDLSQGLSQLADLMRYMLYDAQSDLVLLTQEIAHLRNAVALQRLRWEEDEDLMISFEVHGDLQGKKIAPLILIPFVENAFKHGINGRNGAFVKIIVDSKEQALSFEVLNSVSNGTTTVPKKESGIGLENVMRRLKLIYPGRHDLLIEPSVDTFKISLTLHYA